MTLKRMITLILILASISTGGASATSTPPSPTTLTIKSVTSQPIPIKPTTPVIPAAYFFVEVDVGPPQNLQKLNLLLDISTPLSWAQCTQCSDCFESSGANFNPQFSRPVAGTDPLCKPPVAEPSENSSSCSYDIGLSQGMLFRDLFTLSSGETSSNFTFGCGLANHVDFRLFGRLNSIIGALGLGLGHPTSLFHQLETEQKFSYCLPMTAAAGRVNSTLVIGAAAEVTGEGSQTIQIIRGPDPRYYFNLTGVSVAGVRTERFDMPAGRRGFAMDTTLPGVSSLAEDIFASLSGGVVNYFQAKYGWSAAEQPKTEGLQLCYDVQGITKVVDLPSVKLEFDGGGATMEIYDLFEDYNGEICLLAVSNDGVGPSLLGARLQSL